MLSRRMATNVAVLLFYALPLSGAAFTVGCSSVGDAYADGDSVVLDSCLHVALFVLGFAAFRWLKSTDAAISKIAATRPRSQTAAADVSEVLAESGALAGSSIDAESALGKTVVLSPTESVLTSASVPSTSTSAPPTPQCQQREPASPSESVDLSLLHSPPSIVEHEDRAAPFATLFSHPPWSSSISEPGASEKTATQTSTQCASTTAATEKLEESPTAFSVTRRLSNRTSRRLLKGLATVLEGRLSVPSTSASFPLRPWRRTDFHTTESWSLNIAEYLFELFWYFECSSPCLPIALAYMDRVLASDSRMAFDHQSCHKLLLTSLVLALKFHDDEPPYYNAFYAEFGGVRKEELNALEKQFVKLLDWRFAMQPEEYDSYHHLLMESA